MSNVISELLVSVGADISGMQRGLRQAQRDSDNFGSGLQRLGRGIQRVGVVASAAGAIIGGALAYSAAQAVEFDASMTNARAVLGATADDMADINAEVLALGSNAIAGPQAAAEAYYDIVSGVTDASIHMEILSAAIETSEAGAASLQGTTAALVSIMNSYAESGLTAADASDILTRTVGLGVGTMDEFAAALPLVSGVAAAAGIDFQELATEMAFMTTKGYSASQASSRLNAAISALLNPNEQMREQLAAIGIESGAAALAQYGLAGTLGRVGHSVDNNVGRMAELLGSQEALQAAVTLNQAAYEGFIETFETGMEGATRAAREVQLESVANQFALLQSQLMGIAIQVGSALLPALIDIAEAVGPLISTVADWMAQNQELTAQIVAVGGAAAVAGPAIIAIGAAVAALSSPITAAIALAGAIAAAYATNFGGIRDFIDGQVRPRLEEFFNFLGGVWEVVSPALESIYNWFAVEALPAVVSFIENDVAPIISGLIGLIGGIWDFVGPALESFAAWWGETIPGIISFIEGLIGKVQEAIGVIQQLGAGLGAYSGVADNAGTIGELVGSGQVGIGDVLGAAVNAIGAELGGRAAGGPVTAGGAYIVGEQGPELFVPGRSGRIVPNGAGVGGDTYILNAYGSSPYGLLRDLDRAARMRGK